MVSTVAKPDSCGVFLIVVSIELCHMQQFVVLSIPENDLLVEADSSDYLHFGMVSDEDLVSHSSDILRCVESEEDDGLEVHTLVTTVTRLFRLDQLQNLAVSCTE